MNCVIFELANTKSSNDVFIIYFISSEIFDVILIIIGLMVTA